MSLPTPDNLKTMDYSFQGEPFINIPAKSSIDLMTMDYALQGEPFVGNSGGTAPIIDTSKFFLLFD